MRSGRRQRGFSLLEVVVALAVSALALSLAAGLLVESQRRLDHAARRALDPVGEIAARQIRADLRAAAGVGGWGALWSRDPLELAGHPVGRLIYEKQDDVLYRRTVSGRRPVLHGVSTFRWRRDGAGVVIDLRWQVAPGPGVPPGGIGQSLISRTEQKLFRVTPRGGESRQW